MQLTQAAIIHSSKLVKLLNHFPHLVREVYMISVETFSLLSVSLKKEMDVFYDYETEMKTIGRFL